VLLPGLDGTEVFFRPLLLALPKWIRPIVVTYPMSGANDYSNLLSVVRGAIEDCEEFYVLGWSFSGPLALMLAAAEPDRTRGVILCASFIRCPRPVLRSVRFALVSPIVRLARIAHRLHPYCSKQFPHSIRRDTAETLCRVPSSVVAARVRVLLDLDARQCLRTCRPPVLYLAASRDRVVPRWNAVEVVRELPSAKLVTMAGPHLALYTNPTHAARAITGFILESEELASGI